MEQATSTLSQINESLGSIRDAIASQNPFWPTVIGALIGALIGLIGAVIGAAITIVRDKRKEHAYVKSMAKSLFAETETNEEYRKRIVPVMEDMPGRLSYFRKLQDDFYQAYLRDLGHLNEGTLYAIINYHILLKTVDGSLKAIEQETSLGNQEDIKTLYNKLIKPLILMDLPNMEIAGAYVRGWLQIEYSVKKMDEAKLLAGKKTMKKFLRTKRVNETFGIQEIMNNQGIRSMDSVFLLLIEDMKAKRIRHDFWGKFTKL